MLDKHRPAYQKLQQFCRHAAMDLLARREHSAKELKTKLHQRKSRLLKRTLEALHGDQASAQPLTDHSSLIPSSNEPADTEIIESIAKGSQKEGPHENISATQTLESGFGQEGDELCERLLEDIFDDAMCDALKALQAENLLSDQRFAEAYVRMRANAGIGPDRIKTELFQRGVSNIGWVENARDWSEDLGKVVYKKTKGQLPTSASEMASLHRFVRYRGFPGSTLKQVLSSFDEIA